MTDRSSIRCHGNPLGHGAIPLGFAVWLLLAGTAAPLLADVQLQSLDATWRYQQATNLDGQSWQSPAYDDSAWPAGKALLYVENNAAVSPKNTPLTIGATTYYFRTHVNCPFDPTNVILTVSARIDDGAVFYLNGQEIQRVRMPAAPAVITYTNLATATPPGGDATSADTFTLSGTNLNSLQTGDNLLAVEVHQNLTTSDDIVFGAAVTVKLTNAAPCFVQQPSDVTVLDGRSATFIAVVDGNPAPALQWYQDGNPLPGATSAWLSFPAAYPTNAGTYWLAATNVFGALVSSNVLLTVLADTNPPAITSAVARKDLTTIDVSFSEPLLASTATATNNYQVVQTILPANQLAVTGVTLLSSSSVRLQTAARTPGLNYSLRISGLRDISSISNQVAPNTEVALSYQVNVLPVDALKTWRYSQAAAQPAANWAAPAYDDSAWPQGAGLFAAGTPLPTGDTVRTTLALQAGGSSIQTYYFRTSFDLPGPVDTNSLKLHHVVDDGAVFYLNGAEAYSIGLPSARPVLYTTAASRYVGTAAYEPALSATGYALPGTNLTQLSNCLAVEVHQSAVGLGDASFGAQLDALLMHYAPQPQLVVPAVVLEGAGTLTNQAWVTIQEPQTNDLVLQMTSSRPSDVTMPATVTIPAGSTNAACALVIDNDALFTGPRPVTLTASSPGLPSAAATLTVLDDDTNILSVALGPVLTEGVGTVAGTVRLSHPADAAITVALASSDVTALTVPASVVFAPGATSAVFQATVVDDLFLDGPQVAIVTASVLGWPTGAATVVVNDNEPATLALTLPATALEGSGFIGSAGKLTLGGLAVTDMVFSVACSLPSSLIVPTNVTLRAGQSNVYFSVTVPDNYVVESNRIVTVTANAPGLPVASAVITVMDNDPDHIRFGLLPLMVDTNTAVGVLLTAENADGSVQTNFNGSLTLAATGVEGLLPVSPTNSGAFTQGQRYCSFRIAAPGHAVRLRSLEYAGQSEPFNVELPMFQVMTQAVADLAWDARSGTLFATVPANGGVYSNRLVAIDPYARTVTNSYPVGPELGAMSLSPDSTYLYVARSNNNVLQRFDLTLRQAGNWFSRGVDYYGFPNFISGFAVPAGFANSVVVATDDAAGNYTGVFRYDNGVPVGLSGFTSQGTSWLMNSPASSIIYGWGPLVRGTATGSILAVNTTSGTGTQVILRQDSLLDNNGNVFAADSLALRGKYPGVWDAYNRMAIVEVDPDVRRTFFFTGTPGSGCPTYAIKVYDRDLYFPLGQVQVPLPWNPPGRFLRWATNSLVFNVDNQIWFLRSDFLQPTQAPADLSLTQALAPLPAVVGSNVVLTLVVSNAGPGLASVICVTNSLPANTVVAGLAPSTGTVSVATSAFTWKLGPLPAGSNATLAVTLRFGNGGWQTNLACALGYEADPVFNNNQTTLPLCVQLPPADSGVFTLNSASEDLLYDPARDRLLLSVGTGGNAGQANGLALLNPYTGLTESFAALARRPSRLVRSGDGQYLYVSLPDDALVRRFDLPTLTQNLEFALGGESIYGTWYPYYANDLAVVPGAPQSLVAWRVRRAGAMAGEYGRGIALFQNGVMASNNVTADGGSWKVVFDTDAGTLFGYNAGDLRRCSLSSNGVSFVEQYPTFYLAGSNIDYAAGQLFTSAGKLVQYQPFSVAWSFPGAESAALVEPDAASSRVFYLVQSGGWQLKAYDVPSRRLLGSVPVPNVAGTPTSLVRWGTNGLAFRTTSNQVFIVRTPLVQPAAVADLAVAIEGPDTPVDAGKDALLIFTVTNRGPLSASTVVVTNTFAPAVSINWSFCTDGSIVTTNGQVIWTLPQVQAAQDALAAVVIRAAQTGMVSVAANVTSATPEAQPADNSAFLALPVGGSLGRDSAAVLQLAANDLVWSPAAGRLLLTASNSTPNWAGTLLSLNPATLTVRPEAFLGADAGRLAASRDDSVLYAGVDSGVGALTLPSLALTNRFLLDPSDSQRGVYDMEVVPGSNQSLVVGSRSRTSNGTWLGAYDGSQVRTSIQSFYTTGLSLEFGDDPSLFYYQDFAAGGFRRYSLNPQGISLLETITTLLPPGKPIDLKWANGLLYSGVGTVIDPVTRQAVRTIPGLTNNSPLCYDSATKRVFYLMPVGSNAVLHAVDASTTVPLGSLLVSGFSGTPAGLVRWGADGLAFRTSSGQIELLRSSLVPSDPPADLQLSISASNTLAFVGSNFVYALAVTNLGPNAASNAQIALKLPTTVSIVAASSSQGTTTTGPQQVLANLGTLLPGGTAQAFVTVVPVQPGSVVALASATAGALDPDPASNVRSLTNTAVLFVARDMVAVLNQAAADLVINPATGRLYASGNGASVAVINPALAQVETTWPVPTQPGRLVVSGDGQALYVSHDAGRQLARLETAAGGVLTNFSLGTNTSGAAFSLVDMEAIPGAPRSVVVNETASGYRYLAVMDDSVTRSNRPVLPYPSNGSFLEFGPDPSVVYVSGLMPILLSTDGATVVGGSSLFSTTSNFKYDSGWFYTDAGQQVDPTNRIAVTRFSGLGTGTLVLPEVARRRVYFLSRISNVWQLRAQDPVTTDLVGSIALTNVAGTPAALVRWGDDGLAFCTTSNQVFLLRPSFVPGGPSADLQVTQTPTPLGPVDVGSNVTFTVQVTNAGPASAANVLLLSALPTNAALVQVQLSQGTTNLCGSLLTCSLGTLTNGGTAQFTVTLRPLFAGALVHRLTATSANTDADLSNNTVTSNVGVQLNLAPGTAGSLDLQAADIAYDPVSGLLYASLTNYLGAPYEGALVSIDPVTGMVLKSIPIAPNLTQLALADDGSRLYVLANNGQEFWRVNLALGAPELRVVASATEIKAVPGQPQSLALVPGSGVVIYDDAVPRPASLIWYDHIEFFAPNLLLGFWASTSPSWTARLALMTNGVSVDSGNITYLVDGTMKAERGLIYTSGGSVFDPMTLTKIRSFGVSGPVAPDHTVDRVCYLTGSGSSLRLRSFDTHGLLEWGTVAITNGVGTPDKLLRCGADRLAFHTSGGQVFIVRNSAISGGAPADLALGVSPATLSPTVGQPFDVLLSITNSGPNAGTGVTVTNSLPSNMVLLSSSASVGTATFTNGCLTWQVGELSAGSTATNRLTFVPGEAGVFVTRSVLQTSARDTNSLNNVALQTWLIQSTPSQVAVVESAVMASDAIWDGASQRLYLSLPSHAVAYANCVLPLDPATGAFETPFPVGLNPGKLAVSDNGQYLYVGLNATASVARVRLAWRTVDLAFPLNTGYDAREMVVLPGQPDTVAIARRYFPTYGFGEPAGLSLYRNGAELPQSIAPYLDVATTITCSTNPARLYGYNGWTSEFAFRRYNLNSNGLTVQDATGGLLSGYDLRIEFAGGLLFASSGAVIQPETLSLVTNLPGINTGALVKPDLAAGLLSFLTQSSGNWLLRQYAHSNYALLREFRIPGVQGTPQSLTRWGTDGLAFLTSSNQFFLLRPPLATVDLAVQHTLWPTQVIAGQSFQMTLSVTNQGPYAAQDVLVTNTLPAWTSLLATQTEQGTATNTAGKLVFALGTIPANSAVRLSLTLLPTNTANTSLTNLASVSSAFPDLNLADNTALALTSARADSDRDGLPDDWELARGLNPTNAADALLDSDGDGLCNLQEYLQGTDPFVFDGLRILSTRINGKEGCELTVHGAVGVTYALEGSSNLVQWFPVRSFVCQSTNYLLSTPSDAAVPAMFFRLHATTNPPVPILSLSRASLLGPNQPLLQLAGPPGYRYAVAVSSNLTDWSELTNFYATTCATCITDPRTNRSGMRFYRGVIR